MLLNTTISMDELFSSEAKHTSFPWYSSSQSKISDANFSFFPWNSSSPSRNSVFPGCSSSQSAASLMHKFGYILEHGPYDLGLNNKHTSINHDQVGTKGSTKELIFGRHSFSLKNLFQNPTLAKLASYKSSILKFLHSMKPENCSTPNVLCNLNHYVVPSPSAAPSGISTSLKRTSYFLLSLGALRHYHNHGRLPLKPAQIMLYKRQLRHCIKHVYQHRNVYMVGLGVTIVGLGVTIVLVSSRKTIPYSRRKHFVIIPDSKDKSFGNFLFKLGDKIGGEYKILPLDHPHSVQVRSISNKILQALQSDLKIKKMNDLEFGSMNINGNFDEKKEAKLQWWRRTKSSTRHLEGLNWEVVVSDEHSCNARCVPGGRIVVHEGLFTRLKSDAEVAAVIAHEVGHVVARHSAETWTQTLWFSIGWIIFLLLSNSATSFLGTFLQGQVLGRLILNPGSRRREKEADYIGLLLMASAGYDPRVAPKVYEILDDTKDLYGELRSVALVIIVWLLLTLLSTHPSGKQRSEALSKPEVMEEAMIRFSKTTQRQRCRN